MKITIEGTEEEIKRCLDRLAGEKVRVDPVYVPYPTYPQTVPFWEWRPYTAPYTTGTFIC